MYISSSERLDVCDLLMWWQHVIPIAELILYAFFCDCDAYFEPSEISTVATNGYLNGYWSYDDLHVSLDN